MYIDTHTHRLKSNRQKQAHRHRYKNREIKIARYKETNRIQTWITRYTYMHRLKYTFHTPWRTDGPKLTDRDRQTKINLYIYAYRQTKIYIYIQICPDR